MTIEISICDDPTANLHPVDGSVRDPFNLHFVGKDEACRKLWAIPSVDENGVPKKYNSIQEALRAAVEKLRPTVDTAPA
jgi:hypothetical protein